MDGSLASFNSPAPAVAVGTLAPPDVGGLPSDGTVDACAALELAGRDDTAALVLILLYGASVEHITSDVLALRADGDVVRSAFKTLTALYRFAVAIEGITGMLARDPGGLAPKGRADVRSIVGILLGCVGEATACAPHVELALFTLAFRQSMESFTDDVASSPDAARATASRARRSLRLARTAMRLTRVACCRAVAP